MKIVVTVKVIHDDGSAYQETLLTLQKTAEQGEPLGLSLNESKILLNSTQLAIIQAQSQSYMQAHRECPLCHQRRQIKDHQTRHYHTLFGVIPIKGLRLYRCRCETNNTKSVSLLSEWLPENTHPELKYIEAKWASLMSYDLTVDRLKDILPINNALNASTVRNHLISVAKRQEAELAEQPDFLDKFAYDNKQLPRPGKPMVIGFDGGYVRDCHNRKNNFEIITGKAYAENLQAKRFGYVHTFENNPRKRLLSVLNAQGMQTNQQISFLSDGADNLRMMQIGIYPEAEHILDWFHISMRLTVLNQCAKGLGSQSSGIGIELRDLLEKTKWYLWHGNVDEALDKLDSCLYICDEEEDSQVYKNSKKMIRYLGEVITYIDNNQAMIPNYGERYRYGEPISTAFVESTVNEVIAKRMAKKQQMQWSQEGAHYLLQTRVAVLNDELEGIFYRWYPKLSSTKLDTMAA
ncbi:ISKra4 family transposase [Proteus mirabilis]|nr:ISKra4 family transposase [Providencia rettgeri]EKY1728134.1 ISKra4 family transposase [Proteus mirabilis]HBQ4780280.1 ISKra4 family transposase [Escherichia coli]